MFAFPIDFIQASSQLFASPQVVDITEVFLKQDVCQQMSDVKGCERDVEVWYRPMMQAGLVSQDFGQRFCYHYGICQTTVKFRITHTLGQKPTFYPEITKNLMFENVNFVKNDIFKM